MVFIINLKLVYLRVAQQEYDILPHHILILLCNV